MSKSHCSSQLSSWNLYDESGSKLLVSNANITIQNYGNNLKISTENFNWNHTVYLKNDLYYGSTSSQASIKLIFTVKRCDLVKIKFSDKAPLLEPRHSEYYMINNFPIQKVEQLTTIDTTKTITKNMTVAFVSQDPDNCPVTGYKFEKVNLYHHDILKYPSE